MWSLNRLNFIQRSKLSSSTSLAHFVWMDICHIYVNTMAASLINKPSSHYHRFFRILIDILRILCSLNTWHSLLVFNWITVAYLFLIIKLGWFMSSCSSCSCHSMILCVWYTSSCKTSMWIEIRACFVTFNMKVDIIDQQIILMSFHVKNISPDITTNEISCIASVFGFTEFLWKSINSDSFAVVFDVWKSF